MLSLVKSLQILRASMQDFGDERPSSRSARSSRESLCSPSTRQSKYDSPQHCSGSSSHNWESLMGISDHRPAYKKGGGVRELAHFTKTEMDVLNPRLVKDVTAQHKDLAAKGEGVGSNRDTKIGSATKKTLKTLDKVIHDGHEHINSKTKLRAYAPCIHCHRVHPMGRIMCDPRIIRELRERQQGIQNSREEIEKRNQELLRQHGIRQNFRDESSDESSYEGGDEGGDDNKPDYLNNNQNIPKNSPKRNSSSEDEDEPKIQDADNQNSSSEDNRHYSSSSIDSHDDSSLERGRKSRIPIRSGKNSQNNKDVVGFYNKDRPFQKQRDNGCLTLAVHANTHYLARKNDPNHRHLSDEDPETYTKNQLNKESVELGRGKRNKVSTVGKKQHIENWNDRNESFKKLSRNKNQAETNFRKEAIGNTSKESQRIQNFVMRRFGKSALDNEKVRGLAHIKHYLNLDDRYKGAKFESNRRSPDERINHIRSSIRNKFPVLYGTQYAYDKKEDTAAGDNGGHQLNVLRVKKYPKDRFNQKFDSKIRDNLTKHASERIDVHDSNFPNGPRSLYRFKNGLPNDHPLEQEVSPNNLYYVDQNTGDVKYQMPFHDKDNYDMFTKNGSSPLSSRSSSPNGIPLKKRPPGSG